MILLNLILHNLIYIFAYYKGISSVFIMLISAIQIICLYYQLRKKSISINGSLVAIMGSLIPTSFRNIFGGDFADVSLAWFYIVGGILFIYNVLLIAHWKNNVVISKIIVVAFLTIFITLVPFLSSDFKNKAFSELINYLFYAIMFFISLFNIFVINKKDYSCIVNTYVRTILISSIVIIAQYLIYKFTGELFLRVEFFGGNRTYFSYMFGDMSSATVYMATALVFLFLSDRRIISLMSGSVILSAMAISSARSGLVALICTILVYFIFNPNIRNKFRLLIISVLSLPLIITLSEQVRSFSSRINYFTQDSGRIDGYIEGLKKFADNPIIGNGYDLSYKYILSERTVPHNAIIYMLAQMGIICIAFYLYIFYYIFKISKNLNNDELYYIVILSYIGSMIIPGFIASRFFTVITILIIGYNNNKI